MIPITYRQLEVFVRAVEAGSFRACAEQLSISQVSVGEHIRALERQLAGPLFERRRGSSARLTQAGERVFRQSQTVLSATHDLLGLFDTTPRQRARRRIRICAHGFIAESLAKRLAAFVSDNPDLDIEMQRRSFAEVVGGIADGEVEVGYFLARAGVPEIESSVVWQEELAFFVGPDHPLARRVHVEPRELSGLPFAYLPARAHLRGEIASILTELGITGCPAALTADDHVLILENLAAGSGFACLFADAVAPWVARGMLARVSLSRPVPPMQVRCAVRSAYRADRTVNELLAALAPGERA